MANSVYKFGKHITWSIPVAFQYEPVWGAIYKEFQNYLIDLPQVNGYGSPTCLWTGGRAPGVRGRLDKTSLFKLFSYARTVKLTPSLTFTCTQLSDEDLNDSYCNYLLDMALEFGAHFIVYDERLKNYIREKQSDAFIVSSVIQPAMRYQGVNKIAIPTPEDETAFYNKLLKEYDMVVVRPEYSNTVLLEHPDWIDDISRLEVLINQPCIRECPRMPDHYRHLEQYRNGEGDPKAVFECARAKLTPERAMDNTMCHDDELIAKLVEHGVRHLKIQGRGVGMAAPSLLMMIYGLMFRQDGKNHLIVGPLLQTGIYKELQYFEKNVIGTVNTNQDQEKKEG